MIRQALIAGNVWRDASGTFVPHMTLVYDRRNLPLMPVKRPIAWTASDFVLLFSCYGEGRHLEFGRWPFVSDASPYPRLPVQLEMALAPADLPAF